MLSTIAAALDTPASACHPDDSNEPLTITELSVCRAVQGFGQFEPVDAGCLRAGQEIWLYSEIDGLSAEPDRVGFRARLAANVELLPYDREGAIWALDLGISDDNCRRRRRDVFANYRLVLPRDLPAARYRLRLTQSDRLTGRSASRELTLTVVESGR
jgi:hypothetical protein